MKIMVAHFIGRFYRNSIECEVENELRFHLELLTEEHLRQGMTLQEAEREALKRFGNIERIKNQCVEISKRNHPLMRVLKSFFILVFLIGVLARVFSTNIYGEQIGNLLILIAALSGLLLYIRGSRESSFVLDNKNSLPLGLEVVEQTPLDSNDCKELTPLERVIADD